jgi:hypothetical protein
MADPAYSRAYYLANKDRIAVRSKLWREALPMPDAPANGTTPFAVDPQSLRAVILAKTQQLEALLPSAPDGIQRMAAESLKSQRAILDDDRMNKLLALSPSDVDPEKVAALTSFKAEWVNWAKAHITTLESLCVAAKTPEPELAY